MLQFLLDEHISSAVAEGLRRQFGTVAPSSYQSHSEAPHRGHSRRGAPYRGRSRALRVVCLAEWEGGAFLGQPDEACLRAAAQEGLTLVTYDRRTIPPLLKSWAEQGRRHGGVIFVDEKTIAPSDVGGLVKALGLVWREMGKWDWTDRVGFL